MSIQSGLNLQVCKIGLLSMPRWWMMNGWDDQNKLSFNPIKLALWCLFVNVSKWSSVCQIPFSVGEWSLSESGGSDLPDVAKYFHFHNSIQNTFTFTKVCTQYFPFHNCIQNYFTFTNIYKIFSFPQLYTKYFHSHNKIRTLLTLYIQNRCPAFPSQIHETQGILTWCIIKKGRIWTLNCKSQPSII